MFDKRFTLLESELRVLLSGEGGASLRFGTCGLTKVLPLEEIFLGFGSGTGSPTVLAGKRKKEEPSPTRSC